MKKAFIAQVAGWVSGIHYEAGETVMMTEAQAEYYLLNRQIAAAPEVAETETKTTATTKAKKPAVDAGDQPAKADA